jgi:hypothetical protein
VSIFDNISSLFHHSPGKLPPGNNQWAQLANFFPQDSGAGLAVKGWEGLDPSKKGASHIGAGTILGALGALGGSNQPPPVAPPQFAPMAPPPDLSGLAGAPMMGQRPMMPTPGQYAPYMWGNR